MSMIRESAIFNMNKTAFPEKFSQPERSFGFRHPQLCLHTEPCVKALCTSHNGAIASYDIQTKGLTR